MKGKIIVLIMSVFTILAVLFAFYLLDVFTPENPNEVETREKTVTGISSL